jgi:hypothetical protein
VQVDLEPDVLVGQAEAVEQLGVPLRWLHRRGAAVAVQGGPERLGAGELGGDDVRGVVVVGRHLHGQLAALVQEADQPAEQPRVVGQPVQGGVGEDDVPAALVEGGDVALLEPQAAAGQGRGPLEHRRRAVQAERLGGPHASVELGRQLAAAAAQVDHPAAGGRPDQRQQVVEGCRPLGPEPLVLLRVPGVHGRHPSRPAAGRQRRRRLNWPRRNPIAQVGIGPSRELECGCR